MPIEPILPLSANIPVPPLTAQEVPTIRPSDEAS
jgi:hypothetical protein